MNKEVQYYKIIIFIINYISLLKLKINNKNLASVRWLSSGDPDFKLCSQSSQVLHVGGKGSTSSITLVLYYWNVVLRTVEEVGPVGHPADIVLLGKLK